MPLGRSRLQQISGRIKHSLRTANRDALAAGGYVALAVFALDQVTKWLILYVVRLPERLLVELTAFLNLRMAWNTGVSFGMFPAEGLAGRLGLIAFALGVVGFLIYWLNQAANRVTIIAIGLVIGGALGNVLDRVIYGAVVDFVDFHLFGYHFYTFNVADTAITLGVILLIIEAIFLSSSPASHSRGENGKSASDGSGGRRSVANPKDGGNGSH